MEKTEDASLCSTDGEKPTASVVIVTYGRPEFVKQCLELLFRQTHPPTEIIVIDASPDDSTYNIVNAFADVIYLRNGRGYGHMTLSRNIGLERTSADIVVYIDDDSYTHTDWLYNLVSTYADPSVGAVGGRALNNQSGEDSLGVNEIGRLLPDGSITGYFAANPGRSIEVDHVIGCNMSFRRDVLCRIGGFSDLYTGTELREETDVCLRIKKLGYKVIFNPLAVVDHVAAPYAHPMKWQRFDVRYNYFCSRNTVCLLLRNFGVRHPIVWRYLFTTMIHSLGMFFGRIGKAFVYFGADTAGTIAGFITGVKVLISERTAPHPGF